MADNRQTAPTAVRKAARTRASGPRRMLLAVALAAAAGLFPAAGADAGDAPDVAPSAPEVIPDLPAGLSAARVLMRANSRPAAPDLVAALWTCPRCGSCQAVQRYLPQQPPFDQLADVAGILGRVGLGHGGVWAKPRAEACQACRWRRGEAAAPPVTELILFRYLPETGADAVARAEVRDGRLGDIVWGQLDAAGNYDRFGAIRNETAFAQAFGRPLAVREAWSELIGRTVTSGEPQLLRAGPGFYLTCRPRGDGREEESRLNAALRIALVKAGLDDPDGALWIPLTAQPGGEAPPFRRWLPGQTRHLESGKFLAAAALARGAWVEFVRREFPPGGAAVEEARPGAAIEVRSGDFSAQLVPEEILARTVLSGLSPGEGLVRFVWPEAIRIEKMRLTGEAARQALGSYFTRVENGTFLEVRERAAKGAPADGGRHVARLNIAALAAALDPRRPGAVQSALAGLIGLNPETGRISPPSLADLGDGRATSPWLAVKLRPKGYYRDLGASVLVTDFRGLDAAWSIDTGDFSRLLPAENAPPEKALAARFAAGIEHCVFQVSAAKGLRVDDVEVRAAVGTDIAGALFHERLRRGLAGRLKVPQAGAEVTFWSPNANVVFMSQRPLSGDAREQLRGLCSELLEASNIAPGPDLDVEIRERLTAEAAGVFGGG